LAAENASIMPWYCQPLFGGIAGGLAAPVRPGDDYAIAACRRDAPGKRGIWCERGQQARQAGLAGPLHLAHFSTGILGIFFHQRLPGIFRDTAIKSPF